MLNISFSHYNQKGALYCGIKLDWDYEKRTLDISMLEVAQNVATLDD